MSRATLGGTRFVASVLCVVTASLSSFAAKPYDAVVEYLDANATSGKTMYIDTGLYPSDTMGALIRFAPKSSTASGLFGTISDDLKYWYVGGPSYFFGWNSNNASGERPALTLDEQYDVCFNYMNGRTNQIVKVSDGSVARRYTNIATWTGGDTAHSIVLFNLWGYKSKAIQLYYSGGYYRIWSAKFTRGSEVVMDLIPVRKDGAGYMFDKVTGTLLANTKPSGAPDFVYGDDVADESYIEGSITLDADANWTSRGILHIDSSAVINLNGHSLTIAGAYGTGTITDSSSGTPGTLRLPAGAPFAATTSGNMTVLRSDKPYDAQVEYLEAPLDESGKTPYIDTGLYPGDDMGAHFRFMPMRSADSTLCGVQTTSANKWYFGGAFATNGRGIYMAWMNDLGTRTKLASGSVYEVFFNYLNDRDRRMVDPNNDNEVLSQSSINSTWTAGSGDMQTIWLYHFNDQGSRPTQYYGNHRIYSAQFTQGGNVVMDLIPVRKNGVGYMYDKVSETLLAKVETAPGAFTYVNDAADVAYIEGTVTLDADADWTSRGILRIDPSATIDLNGHSLAIAGAYGTGTITNSSATVGEVHFVVPERMEQTSAIRLLGNLKVVKEGAGTLSLSRTGQTFTGGVVVSAGVATAVADESNGCWGADGGTIRVSSGAVFSINGKGNFYLKDFILDGGTISNNVAMTGYGLGNVTLEADSSIITVGTYRHFIFSSPDDSRSIDLGGHALTVSLEYGTQFYLHEPAVNGTLVFDKQTSGSTGGWLRVDTGKSGGSPTMNLEMDTSAFLIEGELSVSNYVANYSGDYNRGASAVKVYGRFTPAVVLANGTERFHGCEMQDGSTIDLSAKSGTWGNVATGWSGTSNDDDGNRTVTFATNATVTIDVHGRELAKGAKIVAWDAVPENLSTLTFKFDDDTVPLLATGDGIYYNVTDAEVATAHWTGAANDGDVTNPLNWACTNYINTAVAGGLPLGSTEVHVSGDVTFDVTAERPLAYNTLSFDSVRLTNDCDWSGLVLARAGDEGDTANLGSVDLNGHALRLAAPQIAATLYDFVSLSVTDSSSGDPGELRLGVPLAETQLICTGLELTGNLKLVKDGPGDLGMTRANQAFTGGVLIAEGKGYLPGRDFSETNLFWGPVGGTITVVTNATFDASGNNDFYLKNFVLNGGTLANTYGMGYANGEYGFGNVTLVADSYFVSDGSDHTVFSAPGGTGKIDLGGHTLTVSIAYGDHFFMQCPVENGTMVFDRFTGTQDGGYLHVRSGCEGGSQTVSIDMRTTALQLHGPFSVSNYVARYTNDYNYGAAALKVYGTFTPVTAENGKDYFHGCEMQDGSMIDLSAKSAVWSNVATGWTGAGNTPGNRTITFADNATVTIDLHGRELAKGDLVVTWGDVPANLATLTFVSDAATDKPLLATEVGIYYDLTANEAATAHWTGAANDKDVTNPANWACTNFFGGEVENGLPVVSTKVYVSGDVALDITSEKPLAFESLTFSSARLARDCDWSGLEWAITANGGDTVNLGSIDLNGHSLRLAAPTADDTFYDCISLAVSDGSAGDPGELHLEVPSASAKLICTGLALSGNVKLVKDGLGWLAMARAGQTFTGGVFVAEGTAGPSAKTSFPESGSYWGVRGGTITVVTNATFDASGNNDFYLKNFVLNGGTLANTTHMDYGTGKYGFGNVTLVADSYFDMRNTTFLNPLDPAAKVDLGGHSLTVELGASSGANLYMPVSVENGSMTIASGGYLKLDAGTSGGSASVNLEMSGAAFYTDGAFSVSNYVARYAQKWNHGAQPLIVYGTFTPAAVDENGKEYFHGCEVQNGSCIDLSGKTNAWSSVATGWLGTGDADGSRTVTFADNATVTIDLGTRRVKTLEKVVDWSAAVPANLEGLTFYGVANGGRVKLKVESDGLYMPPRGMTIVVR